MGALSLPVYVVGMLLGLCGNCRIWEMCGYILIHDIINFFFL